MAPSGKHALDKTEEQPAVAGGVGEKTVSAKDPTAPHKEHDYVMVGEDSSREQSFCPTPVGTPHRAMLPGDSLQLQVPSADVSPMTAFGSLDPKGLAALQAAFHENFADEGKRTEEHADSDKEAALAAPEDAEGLVDEQSEVTTPAPTKELRPVQDADSSPEGTATPAWSSTGASEASSSLKQRLEEAQREIERLMRALEDGRAQQEWMLGNVLKSTAAQKEELTSALQGMQDECNALELELKHHEKGFAELVSQELEQRFVRFEEVTLAAVQKMVGIISAPAAAAAGAADATPAGLAAGMSFDALSLPGGVLTAPLGAVPPGMTLLDALQTRQAQDALSALEAARAPSRHPLDISLQARARLNSAVTTLCASARRGTCFRSRLGGAVASTRRSLIKGAQGTATALGIAGKAATGGVLHSARCIDAACDKASAATECGVKIGAAHVKHATQASRHWVQDRVQKEKLGQAVGEVPGALAAPFKAFGRWSVYMDKQRRQADVRQVACKFLEIVSSGVYLTVAGALYCLYIRAALDAWEGFKISHDRRHKRERLLKSQVCDLETTLNMERTRAEEAEKAAAKAERRLQQAFKEARRGDRQASKAGAHGDASAAEFLDLSRAAGERDSNEGAHIWHMEPEELFSWNGFPDLDLRGLVSKIRGRHA